MFDRSSLLHVAQHYISNKNSELDLNICWVFCVKDIIHRNYRAEDPSLLVYYHVSLYK
jgi:hypothetical protein